MEEMKLKMLNEVKGVAYIGFKVSDVKRAVPWYVANLGCEIRQQDDGLAILKLPWGPDIELNKTNPNELDKSLPFGFYVKNIEKYHSQLKENGVKVNEIIDQGGCGLLFQMYDPDGIEIHVWGGYKRDGEEKPDNWID
jgi:predicted enzyme related to lactoylglutathione lyase